MKTWKALLSLLLVIATVFALAACSLVSSKPSDDDDDDWSDSTKSTTAEQIITAPPETTYTVKIADGEHFTVDGDSEKKVVEGEDVTFTVTPETGYILDPSVGIYDEATSTLTLTEVTEDITVTITAQDEASATFRVSVKPGDGFTATPAETTVRLGENATFQIALIGKRTRVADVTAGTFDESTSTLTVPNVRKTTEVEITVGSTSKGLVMFGTAGATSAPSVAVTLRDGTAVKNESPHYYGTYMTATVDLPESLYFVGWTLDKTAADGGEVLSAKSTFGFSVNGSQVKVFANFVEKAKYSFSVVNGSASVKSGSYDVGTSITVVANDGVGVFRGWALGEAGGTVVSTDKTYTFKLTGDTVLVADYSSDVTITYHLNGGSASGKDTYTQTVNAAYFTSPNTLYDDGSFTRDGYVLVEYNTKADGTGTAYSLGSKTEAKDGAAELYCIWKKASTGFTKTAATVSKKLGSKTYTYEGVAITGYSGTDTEVVVPEKIDGKEVVAIKANAFKNKNFTTLVLPRTVREVENGAIVNCTSFTTLVMSDSVISISDDVMDSASHAKWTNFYLNASTAPRYSTGYDGGYRVKWDRLMAGVASGKKMVIFVSGSSSLHGIATDYLEALLGDEYFVVEYGTVRTTNNMVYMEAISNFVGEGDIIVYAPENSVYQFGCTELTYKLFRDLESSQNVWRFIDIGKYTNVFGAFAQYQSNRWGSATRSYTDHPADFDANGDYQNAEHHGYCVGYAEGDNNHGYFTVTLNEMVNSTSCPVGKGISVSNESQWISLKTYATDVKRVIGKVTATGARVYFGFSPVNENALTEDAKTSTQQKAFDKLITDTFGFETLGSCSDHIYQVQYMYKGSDGSDFHLNDYGRAINTYKVYTNLCKKLGLTPSAYKDAAIGTDFAGCLFE